MKHALDVAVVAVAAAATAAATAAAVVAVIAAVRCRQTYPCPSCYSCLICDWAGVALELHTDLNYREKTPGLQVPPYAWLFLTLAASWTPLRSTSLLMLWRPGLCRPVLCHAPSSLHQTGLCNSCIVSIIIATDSSSHDH